MKKKQVLQHVLANADWVLPGFTGDAFDHLKRQLNHPVDAPSRIGDGIDSEGDVRVSQCVLAETTAANSKARESIGWNLTREWRYPDDPGADETRFAIVNGYQGIRGCLDLEAACHDRGTFVAGVFCRNALQGSVLVNAPDCLRFSLSIDGMPLVADEVHLERCVRTLHMRDGIVSTEWTVRDAHGRVVRLRSEKLASTADKHLSAFEVRVEPLGFDAEVVLTTWLDGNVSNQDAFSGTRFVCQYVERVAVLSDCMGLLACRTKDGTFQMMHAAELLLESGGEEGTSAGVNVDVQTGERPAALCQRIRFEAKQDQPYRIVKRVCTMTTRDVPASALEKACIENLLQSAGKCFQTMAEDHAAVLHAQWKMTDIVIEGDFRSQIAIRYNLLQLMLLGFFLDGRTSVGAKGLHGEGYQGRVFWDTEIFLLPFYLYTAPDTARKLLQYRYDRLEAAEQNARKNGHAGARFPWQSTVSGEEETPDFIVLKDGTRIEVPDAAQQIHVTADIAYACHMYGRLTCDEGFRLQIAEVLLRTAMFWASRLEASSNGRTGVQPDAAAEAADRKGTTADVREASAVAEGCATGEKALYVHYELRQVKGPDEFHPCIDNNHFTNSLVKWNLRAAADIVGIESAKPEGDIARLFKRYGVSVEMAADWRRMADCILLQPDVDAIISQFDGFFKLKDRPVTEYDEKGMPVLPEAFQMESDFHDHQLLKQPDVIMLMHLFPDAHSLEQKQANYDYYEPRTIHKSSLSPCIHSIMGVETGRTERAFRYFDMTVNADLDDNQRNTTQGIHAASLGGAWQTVVLGFGGLRAGETGLSLKPWLPLHWISLTFRIRWRKSVVEVHIEKNAVILRGLESGGNAVEVTMAGRKHMLLPGGEARFERQG